MNVKRPRRRPPIDHELVLKLLADGLSIRQTARAVRRSPGRVWQIAHPDYVLPATRAKVAQTSAMSGGQVSDRAVS